LAKACWFQANQGHNDRARNLIGKSNQADYIPPTVGRQPKSTESTEFLTNNQPAYLKLQIATYTNSSLQGYANFA
jgi:hypothetical protein